MSQGRNLHARARKKKLEKRTHLVNNAEHIDTHLSVFGIFFFVCDHILGRERQHRKKKVTSTSVITQLISGIDGSTCEASGTYIIREKKIF